VAASATVTIQGFKFNPDTVTIPVGGTVTWTNADSATHTVKAADFISDNIPTGATYSHTFTTKGTFQYNCGIHPSMQGTVVVE
jgi:plastocyanin